ncbi:MAG TPA: sodium:proton antiporter [Bacteroidaceae bacterium]|nr:sodium:proton antiporter [Bacteroidaceae bacterium]
MEIQYILELLLFIILSLIAGGILQRVLRKSPIPYTAGLFLLGLIAGLLGRIKPFGYLDPIENAIMDVGNMDPDLILYLFLPILVFDAAYELDFHIFKKNLVNASILAIPGLLFSTILTAAAIIGLSKCFGIYGSWTWPVAIMFGGLISATDPVAVVALLKELKTSKRFSTLVDAESMLNDGTGIVVFMLFFTTVKTAFGATSTSGFDNPFLNFIFVVSGGATLGLIMAWGSLKYIKAVSANMLVQISVILVNAYLVFILAQEYLNVSGVIALVCYGLYVSYYGSLCLKQEVNDFMKECWELLAYIGNTAIFIIVGIVIAMNVHFNWTSLLMLGLIYIAVNIIRLAMIFFFRPVMKLGRYGLTRREGVILAWGGLRGALGLTLALIVYNTSIIPLEIREEVLFQTAGIVALTLTINATTIAPLLRYFHFTESGVAQNYLAASARRLWVKEMQEYYESLRNKEQLEDCNWEVVEKHLPKIHEALPECNELNLLDELRLRIARQQKLYVWELLHNGVIQAHSLQKLQALADDLYDSDGKIPLQSESILFVRMLRRGTRMLGFKAPYWYRGFLDKFFPARTVKRYDVTRGFILIQKNALQLVQEYESSEFFAGNKHIIIEEIRAEIAYNLKAAEHYMRRLKKRHPVSFRQAITIKTERMLDFKNKSIRKKLDQEGVF